MNLRDTVTDRSFEKLCYFCINRAKDFVRSNCEIIHLMTLVKPSFI